MVMKAKAFRIEEEIYELAMEKAKKEKKTLSKMIRRFLREYVESK